MTVNIQAVIQAIAQAAETSGRPGGPRVRKPVVTISRDLGSGGDEVAHALAERLGVNVYDRQILEAVAKHAKVNKKLLADLHGKVSKAADAWLYAMIFGKPVTRDDYLKHLVTVVRALYPVGGVILGRGANVILAGRDVLRLRITGSAEACARRVAMEQHVDIADAKALVRERNKERGLFVWEMFRSRSNDPINFDLVINTDHFPHYGQVVDLIMHTISVLGLDQPATGTSKK